MALNQNQPILKIERKSEVLERVGLSNATLHRRIKEGTFPPAIKLGGDKAIGFMSHEIDAFLIACALDRDHKLVVKDLLRQRNQLKQASPFLQAIDFH